jgi:hypothetical protein
MIRAIYAAALFVSAILLFLIQPMIAKMILPLLGGTPAVWNTCLVFFQATLLAGYLYAYGLSRWQEPRRQSLWHLGMLVLPFLMLPLMLLPLRLLHGTSLSSTAPVLILLDNVGVHSWLLQTPDPAHPVPWLLMLMITCVGLPFFVVSATAPLLQHWFATTGQPNSNDPYFLYAASNAGSILALLAYPVIVEPHLALEDQAWAWQIGYGLLVGLIVLCIFVLWRGKSRGFQSQIASPLVHSSVRAQGIPRARNDEARPELRSTSEYTPATWTVTEPLSLGRRLRWLILTAIPSSLLLGVTTFLTTNVAAVPLLWIVPLTLYLLTFVLVFARSPLISNRHLGRILPFVILVQTFVFAIELARGSWILFVLHLGCFFLTALFLHGRLAQDRPHPQYLTEFYLWLAAGGVAGGLFNVLIAPLIFNGLVEYPLALVLACLFLPWTRAQANDSPGRSTKPITRGRIVGRPVASSFGSEELAEKPEPSRRFVLADLWLPLALTLLMTVLVLGLQIFSPDVVWLNATLLIGLPGAICYMFIDRPIRFALGIAALLLVGEFGRDVLHSRIIHRERNFFGVLTVVDRNVDSEPPLTFRYFVHGDTNHGQQNLDPEHHRDPLAYYSRTGPIGQLFDAMADRPIKKRVAVLGLGAGAMACYAEDHQDWTFYEINPNVEFIAKEYFTFLNDARNRGVRVQVIGGDGRLSLAQAPDGAYDLIFADAFSSDAVPVHLLTRQALELYLSKLADGGLIVFNVTNRYVNLEPVLGTLAEHAGLVCISRKEDAKDLTEAEQLQGKIASHWVVMARQEADLGKLAHTSKWKRVPAAAMEWTDDFSNLLGAFRW